MRSLSPGEKGAITAEMMITLPVVVMVFGISVVGLQAGLIQYRLQATASDDARLASLGMPVENVRYDEDLVCVTRTQSLSGGVWALWPVSLGARACALNPAGNRPGVSDDF